MYKKILFFLFGITLFPIFFAKNAYASLIFYDNFDSKDLNKWDFKYNQGNIDVTDGILHLSSTEYSYPIITNSLDPIVNNISNYVIDFRFNFEGVNHMGAGMGVGFTNVSGFPFYILSIWKDTAGGPVLQYKDFSGSDYGYCNLKNAESNYYSMTTISLAGKLNGNEWHNFRIEKIGSMYNAYIDSDIVFTTPNYQCTPKNVFIGNPLTGGLMGWTKIGIDYFRIYNGGIPENKVIILPGLGASWNPEAILLNSTAPSLQWSMTPFVKNYDLLEKALEDNNYTKNQDYFVWNYDWRKPLASIVSDFNNYVESLNLNEGEKINLVGHSLGGLTARLWAQDHQDRVNQIISLGSPHYGAVKAYEAWNGAKISDSVDFSSIALNVLLQLQKKNNNSSVETLRNYAPIIKDLIPTFPFLKKNGAIVATANKNQYLLDKNSVISPILGQMNSISGIGVTTKEWINLSERSLFDKVLGIWDEGRASSYVYGAGDGTVLKKSALIPASRIVEINSKHGELPDKSVNLVLNTLGLGITVNSATNYPQKQTVFYLGSPATMKVDCNGIVKDEIGGWVVIENRESKGCKVFLKGKDGGGTYHLVVGDESGWNYFESNIDEAEEKQITIGSAESNWLVLRYDLSKLGATQAVVAADSRDILKTIEAYMSFRVLKKDFRYSEEVLEKMRLILNEKQVTSTEIQKLYYTTMGDKSVVESNLRLMARSGISPKYSVALTDYQAESLMSLGKNYAANYLADKLYKIVWK